MAFSMILSFPNKYFIWFVIIDYSQVLH